MDSIVDRMKERLKGVEDGGTMLVTKDDMSRMVMLAGTALLQEKKDRDLESAVQRAMHWLSAWSKRLGPDASLKHRVNAPFSLAKVILGATVEEADSGMIEVQE